MRRHNKRRVLPSIWFERSALIVARELLGKYLVRRLPALHQSGTGPAGRQGKGEREVAAMITEVEAYIGPEDLASHAARGRRTARTAVMFGRPGRWYVYFTYGMHWLANVVTGREGHPAAVLIRGVADVSGHAPRGMHGRELNVVHGPARVARTFRITGSFTDMPANRRSGLWIEDRGICVSRIVRGPRVGVGYAGPVWAKKPYRFLFDAEHQKNHKLS